MGGASWLRRLRGDMFDGEERMNVQKCKATVIAWENNENEARATSSCETKKRRLGQSTIERERIPVGQSIGRDWGSINQSKPSSILRSGLYLPENFASHSCIHCVVIHSSRRLHLSLDWRLEAVHRSCRHDACCASEPRTDLMKTAQKPLTK
ncbi:hypothetical protein CLCR_06398 [Cladophialophora carrionii]|uniref:Uncharacterized protein n=1 Tax=Cladophialophora carrionii TaxID=86049 RepID=A0A1C1C9E9_9EURO|nr:hypothetical protein CLCR_06398 [Cladophialophora carrionii]